jgi:hypothetical protein
VVVVVCAKIYSTMVIGIRPVFSLKEKVPESDLGYVNARVWRFGRHVDRTRGVVDRIEGLWIG